MYACCAAGGERMGADREGEGVNSKSRGQRIETRRVRQRRRRKTVAWGWRGQPFIIRQNAKRARHFNRNRFLPRKKKFVFRENEMSSPPAR